MELVMNDRKFRKIVEDALVDMLNNKPEVFRKIFSEAIEDVCFANAISEGRRDEFVPETEIMASLSE